MMINKRLISNVSESKKYIGANVAFQWCSLAANITMMASITKLLENLHSGEADSKKIGVTLAVAVCALIVRFICSIGATKMSFLSTKTVKKKLRNMIYEKLLALGASYNEKVKTSEIVQLAVEGVDQLETYFGAYLPQFFYAMLAPLTLFIVLSFVNFPSAVVLLICVPLIPVSIVAVQRWAKKLLSKYWGQYTALGDTFLENLQGLVTLKIYQSDDFKSKEMDEEAEKFRKITMRVLTMQLNSITIMDLIAYGGAAVGVILAVTQYMKGNVGLSGCLLIILLSADFFIPMRQLGSFFHIAMNSMAASDKIFRLLDLDENTADEKLIENDNNSIEIADLHFSYDETREILHGVSMNFPENSFTAIVGESGCGKSTIASILMGRNKNYTGSMKFGSNELKNVREEALNERITYISHNSYLFKGSVKDNLLMGKPDATESELWAVLDKTNLSAFLKSENGLETAVAEKGTNLSGGQCQRIALARALLHDSPVYIFDEATSNIDADSENDIISLIYSLAKKKTVILISHRLANIVGADNIYVLENGNVTQNGNHGTLMETDGLYRNLWLSQQSLEAFGKDGGTK